MNRFRSAKGTSAEFVSVDDEAKILAAIRWGRV
jgi:hypothetical protein